MIFVTSNQHKFEEAKIIIPWLERYNMDLIEPQDSIELIAMYKAIYAYSKIKKPLIVEDTGLFLDALNGFPGEYSVWLYKKIGCKGILDLLKDKDNRNGVMRTVIAYIDDKGIRLFEGKLRVTISNYERGKGFGFDPILIPEGEQFTLAENPEFKFQYSHRAIAFKNLRRFLEDENRQ